MARATKTDTSADDRAEQELERRVHIQLRDNLVALCEIHAKSLDYANVASAAHRAALEVIESYRREKSQAMRQFAERVKDNGSPDGTIVWNSEKGYHYDRGD